MTLIYRRSERDALPESVFADPKNRLFPVRSATELKDTLGLLSRMAADAAAPLREGVARIARGKGWTLPAGFSDLAEFADDALFDSEAVEFERGQDAYPDGDYIVYPNRKLFPAGWYESHSFGMTPEELTVAAFGCPMAPLDLNHQDTVIRDEYIGHGRGFTGSWEGDDWVMRGDIAVHKFLDPLLKEETKMSTTWNRDDKSLSKIALLLNPRIKDAALRTFAEFATKSHTTNSGKAAIQNLHDHSVRGGAVCNGDNAQMASKSEHKAIQAVHDAMVAAGAACESEKNPIWSYYSTNDDPGTSGQEEPTVSSSNATGGAGTVQTPDAESDAVKGQLAAMQRQIEEMANERRVERASVAFGELFRDKKILPASRPAFEALFARLAEDDEREAVTVEFGEGDAAKKLSRTGTLLALFGAATPHTLDREYTRQVGGGTGANVLYEETGDGGGDEKKDTRSRMTATAKKYTRSQKAGGDK